MKLGTEGECGGTGRWDLLKSGARTTVEHPGLGQEQGENPAVGFRRKTEGVSTACKALVAFRQRVCGGGKPQALSTSPVVTALRSLGI